MEQKNKKLMIFLAGELRRKDKLLQYIRSGSFDFYAADGGYQYAKELELPLKKVLGDFDSIEKPSVPDLMLFPSEKDETDSELALRLGMAEGYGEIWLIAPFGGRMDHTIANLHLLETARRNKVSLKLYDGENFVYLLESGSHVLEKFYRYISFFPWEQAVEVSLEQFKYPLDHYVLTKEKPMGVSNEPNGDQPTIHVHNGIALCVCIGMNQEEV